MSGHLLLFSTDVAKPTAALTGNGTPAGEIRLGVGVLTYRDVADVDDLIAAATELRVMLTDAQARAGEVVVPAAEEDLLAEYQAASNELHYAEQDAVCSFCGEKPSEGVTLIWAQDRWQCSNSDACRDRCIAQEGSDDEDEPQPGGTIYPDLTPQALAGGVPLESLAPEQEDEAE